MTENMERRGPHNLTSVEKKRLRDRRAQQNVRDKRIKHIQNLEQQLSMCKSLHRQQDISNLLRTCKVLQEENRLLRERQSQLHELLASWNNQSPETPIMLCNSSDDNDSSNKKNSSNGDDSSGSLDFLTAPDDAQLFQFDNSVHRIPDPFTPESSNDGPHSVNDSQSPTSDDPSVSVTTGELLTEYPVIEVSDPVWTLGPNTIAPEHAFSSGPPDLSSILEHDDINDATGGIHLFQSVNPGFPIDSRSHFPESLDRTRAARDLIFPQSYMPYNIPFIFASAHSSNEISWDKDKLTTPKAFGAPFKGLSLSWFQLFTSSFPASPCLPTSLPNTNPTPKYTPWDADLCYVLDAPPVPSVQGMLFGSKQNTFASSVKGCLQEWRCGDPERLAAGWLIYSFMKWPINPTAETFARLPSCLRPTPEQLQLPHNGFLDVLLWEKLRVNIIKHQNKYDITQVLRTLGSSLRVKWPRGESLVESNGDDGLIIRYEFLERFMDDDGWGLSSEFITRFPELVEGLDIQKIAYDVEA